MTGVIAAIRGGLIVSCQAYPGEPMRDPRTMAQIAQAAVLGGAVAIRLQGLRDIELAADVLDVPVIGLWKDGAEGVFITPTLDHAVAVAAAGADIVALDGTRRPRGDGRSLSETVDLLRQRAGRPILVMADCGSEDDALGAEDAGADIIGTTLAGYTAERSRTAGPDLELVARLATRCAVPVIAEGRIHTPAHAAQALEVGAWAVCVGTAITHPTTIAGWFRDALAGAVAGG